MQDDVFAANADLWVCVPRWRTSTCRLLRTSWTGGDRRGVRALVALVVRALVALFVRALVALLDVLGLADRDEQWNMSGKFPIC